MKTRYAILVFLLIAKLAISFESQEVDFVEKDSGVKNYKEKISNKIPNVKIVGKPGKIKISWEKIDGVKMYEIYQCTEDGSFNPEPIGITNNEEYIISDTKVGITLWYMVRGILLSEKTLPSRPVSIEIYERPNPTVEVKNGNAIINVKENNEGEKYIFRVIDENKEEKLIETFDNFYSFEIEKSKHYKVQVKIESVSSESDFSEIIDIFVPEAPKLIGESENGTMTLSWNKIEKADLYRLYRVFESGNSEMIFETQTENSFKISNLEGNKDYSFYIKSTKGVADSLNSNIVTLNPGFKITKISEMKKIFKDNVSEIKIDDSNRVSFINGREIVTYDLSENKIQDIFFTTGIVHLIKISSNGKKICFIKEDGKLVVYNLEKDELSWILEENGTIKEAIFSQDGNNILSINVSGLIRVWNLESGNERYVLDSGLEKGNSIDISENGKTFIASGTNGLVKVFDFETGKVKSRIKISDGSIEKIRFVNSENNFITSSADGNIKLYNIEGKLLTSTTSGLMLSEIRPISNNKICWSTYDGKIVISDTGFTNIEEIYKLSTGAIFSFVVSNDYKTIYAACSDKTVKVIDIETKSIIGVYNGSLEEVIAVAVSKDENEIYGAGFDKTLRKWNKNNEISNIFAGGEISKPVYFENVLRNLIFLDEDGSLKQFSDNNSGYSKKVTSSSINVFQIKISDKKMEIVAVSSEGNIEIYDRKLTLKKQFKLEEKNILAFDICLEGDVIGIITKDNIICFYDIEKGERISSLSMNTSLSGIIYMGNKNAAIIKESGEVLIVDIEKGNEVKTIMLERNINSIDFYQKGYTFIYSSDDEVIFANGENGKIINRIKTEDKIPVTLKVNNNTAKIAVGYNNGISIYSINGEKVNKPKLKMKLSFKIEKDKCKLSWDKLEEAFEYRIFAEDNSEVGKCDFEKNNFEFDINEINQGKYFVKAFNKNEVIGNSEKLVIKTIKAPIVSSETIKNNVRLNWKKVDGAKWYNIYKIDKIEENKENYIKVLSKTENNFFEISGLEYNKEFWYVVEAFDENRNSRFSNPEKILILADTKKNWELSTSISGFDTNKSDILIVNKESIIQVDKNSGENKMSLSATGLFLKTMWFEEGKSFAVLSIDGSIKIRDAVSGVVKMQINTEKIEIVDIASSFKTNRIAGIDKNGQVVVWDTLSKEQLFTIISTDNIIKKIQFSNNGEYFAAGYLDGKIKIFDSKTGKTKNILSRYNGEITNLNFSDDDRKIVSANKNGISVVWDIQKEATIKIIFAHNREAIFSKILQNGKDFVTVGEDTKIKLWTMNKGGIRSFKKYNGKTIKYCFLEKKKNLLIIISEDGVVTEIELQKMKIVRSKKIFDSEIITADFDEVNNKLLVGTVEGKILILDLVEMKNIGSFEGKIRTFSSVFIDGNAEKIYACDIYGTIEEWDLYNKKMIRQFEGHTQKIVFAKLNKKTDNFITAGAEGIIKIWSNKSGEEIKSISTGENISGFDIISDREVIFSTFNKKIKICNLETEEIFEISNIEGLLLKYKDNGEILIYQNEEKVALIEMKNPSIGISYDIKEIDFIKPSYKGKYISLASNKDGKIVILSSSELKEVFSLKFNALSEKIMGVEVDDELKNIWVYFSSKIIKYDIVK